MKKIFLLSIFVSFVASANPIKGMQYSADKTNLNKKDNTVELIGNAKVTQGDKVLTGQKIVLNLTTGVAKVDGDAHYAAKNMTVDLSKTE